MGNNSSQLGGGRSSTSTSISQGHQQWTHSFPRDLQRMPHLKVLPEDGLGQRLRSTDNGAILNAEGTIRGGRSSFRHGSDEFRGGIQRSRSIHESKSYAYESEAFQRPKFYKDKNDQSFSTQSKLFGSEPDLRSPKHLSNNDRFGAKNRISRGRKKYKAPAPPLNGDGSSPDSYHWELASGDTSDSAVPQRKLRLFKTRAETHRHSHQRSSNDSVKENMNRNKNTDNIIESRLIQEIRDVQKNHKTSSELEKHTNNENEQKFRKNENSSSHLVRERKKDIGSRYHDRKPPPFVMHRSLSSPEFQAELRAVTEKLRVIDKNKFDPKYKQLNGLVEINNNQSPVKQNTKTNRQLKNKHDTNTNNIPRESSKANKMVTMDHHNLPAKQQLIKSFKENVELKQNKKNTVDKSTDNKHKRIDKSRQESETGNTSRGQPSGKESTPEQSPTRKTEIKSIENEFKTPAKTFYFGMDTNDIAIIANQSKTNQLKKENVLDAGKKINNELNNFLAYKVQRQSSSESALSSEPDLEDHQLNGHDISMQLRPTLPKKQLDIPRFSPATAWRLLSIVDTNNQNANTFNENEEGPVFMEERIERLSRPMPNIPLLGHRSSHDKSGDSGISGDAGPALIEDLNDTPLLQINNAKVNKMANTNSPIVAWTPQQDLEEEASSSDGEFDITKLNSTTNDIKFHARNHVFSLSLPRESRLTQCTGSDKSRPQGFNSLQKLRKSLGAALSSSKTRTIDETSPVDVDDNWFLSTSAPNSLNQHNSTMYKISQNNSDEEDDQNISLNKEPTMLKTPSLTYLAFGGHVMYLPTNEKDIELRTKTKTSLDDNYRNDRVRSVEIPCRKEFGMALRKLPMSKSCENISNEMKQINRTPSPNRKSTFKQMSSIEEKINNKSYKGKRFTFQSTVRQIERRRLAEKLSKEAERKEKQRLSELEAMRRVEEEFQRKRAREKASIRQQLRLYSLDENSQQSNWEQAQLRSEPDGAVSSSPAPSPTNNNNNYNTKQTLLQPKDSTPYINKIVEQKMCKNSKTKESNNNIDNMVYNKKTKNYRSSPVLSKRINKNDHRSSPITRNSDDGRMKTEILSEYKQPTREYKEYRGYLRYNNNNENSVEHQTTIHPQVVYQMPKASQGMSYHEVEGSMSPHSDNYRRDFAHGAIPTSSDSELSQPNTRSHSPRHLPRLRTRLY